MLCLRLQGLRRVGIRGGFARCLGGGGERAKIGQCEADQTYGYEFSHVCPTNHAGVVAIVDGVD